jgi:hypothetical protein
MSLKEEPAGAFNKAQHFIKQAFTSLFIFSILSDPSQAIITWLFADSHFTLWVQGKEMTVTVIKKQLLFCFPLFNCQGAPEASAMPAS